MKSLNKFILKPGEDNLNYSRPWLKYYSGNTLANIDYPEKNMYQMIEFVANKAPDNLAIEYMGCKLKFNELLDLIDQCAKSLFTIGVRDGDKVTICLPNIPQATILFYAVNKIGAISNMIHPLSAPKEIEYYVNLTESKFIFTSDIAFSNFIKIKDKFDFKKVVVCKINDFFRKRTKLPYWALTRGKIPKIQYDNLVLSWKTFLKEGSFTDFNMKSVYSPDIKSKPAVILYTGGTTGKQKGVLLSNLNFNALALQTGSQAEVSFGDKMMCIMPFFHGFGLGVSMHTALSFGGECILVPKFTSDDFAKSFAKHKPNFIAGVPTLFTALMKTKKMQNGDFSCLKGVFSGGDTLPNDIKLQFEEFMSQRNGSVQIMEGYGLTETVTASCLTPETEYRFGSIGIPFPDTLYKIVKIGTEETAEIDEDGEICISGPTVMLEYFKEEEETEKVLKTHSDGHKWVHSGDLGSMDKDGFIYFKQRIKRIIKSSGYSVFPSQIENVLIDHEAVANSCVIGVPDDYQIEKIRAYIILENGYEPSLSLKSDILKHCREYLAKWSSPREFVFRDELPLTKVGKISFTELEKEVQKEIEDKNKGIFSDNSIIDVKTIPLGDIT